MKTIRIDDRRSLETFFRRDVLLHIYSLGDLDEAFWPHTEWHGLVEDGRTLAVALLYTGLALPTLLCLGRDEELPHCRRLLDSLRASLPDRFYCHLLPGLADVLSPRYAMAGCGRSHKMGLADPGRLPGSGGSHVAELSRSDLPELRTFYSESYPDNWFEPRMLDTRQYLGLRVGGRLVSVAGVHVYSPTVRVAALGNIATHPEHRGKGYGREVTGRLCRRLLESVDHIGLNVKADNAAAVACYRSLGFEIVGDYEEYMADTRSDVT